MDSENVDDEVQVRSNDKNELYDDDVDYVVSGIDNFNDNEYEYSEDFVDLDWTIILLFEILGENVSHGDNELLGEDASHKF